MVRLFNLTMFSRKSRACLWLSALLFLTAGCHSQTPENAVTPAPAASPPPVKPINDVQARSATVEVVKAYPHDPKAFTQGLLWHDGELYESTGLEGRSSLRRVDLLTGKVMQIRSLSGDIFGEGLCLAGGKLIQISWQNQRAFIYDSHSFAPLGEWSYTGEGWGLAYDGHDIIMSDGSDYLTWRDPQTFQEKKRLQVTYNGQPLKALNELEWIDGEVWANVWRTDYIVRIDPQSGVVTEYIDCSGLLKGIAHGGEDVLNGIAYDPDKKRIFITGKLWPRLFEIKVREK